MRPDNLFWIIPASEHRSSQADRYSLVRCAVAGGAAVTIAVGMLFTGAAAASESAETSVSSRGQDEPVSNVEPNRAQALARGAGESPSTGVNHTVPDDSRAEFKTNVESKTNQNMTNPAAVFEGIRGTVRTLDGRPLGGVFVQAQPSDPKTGPVPDIAIISDENGVYRWRLTPGQYTVYVNPKNFEAQAASVKVDAGKTTVQDFIVQQRR